jgi:hypothetical protein
MSERPKFDPSEIKDAGTYEGYRGILLKRYKTPITPKENIKLLYEKKLPYWVPGAFGELNMMRPDCLPDTTSRGVESGFDMFGVEWTYVEMVNGSMVRPGKPKIPDITHWEDYIQMPDVDSWDWAGSYERHKDRLDPTRMTQGIIVCGFFERLISLMDFENAAVALIDEEQQEAVHRFFGELVKVYDKMVENYQKWFGVGVIQVHDDWGSQRAPFFSIETCREMILPYVKQLADNMHKRGIYYDCHCCGMVEPLVPVMIEAGFDSWGGQEINDKRKLQALYGDQIIWSIPALDVPENASDEAALAAAKEYMENVAKRGGVQIGGMRTHPKLAEYVYELSRKAYCD